MYGTSVWRTALLNESNCKKLDKVSRTVCIGVTGALRTTSTEALFHILNIPPSDVYSQFVAAKTAICIYSVGFSERKV